MTNFNKVRSISVPEKESWVKIPLLGTILAGEPIETIQQNEFISVPKTKLPKSGQVYALRIVGNSMIDENIRDGDLILVKQQTVTENNKIPNRLIKNQKYERALKRINKNQRKYKLCIINQLRVVRKCPACNQKEDLDGRCKCVNQDAW